jgi:hypothetical protein
MKPCALVPAIVKVFILKNLLTFSFVCMNVFCESSHVIRLYVARVHF